MILNYSKRLLFLSECVRIIATIFVLNNLNIPIFFKIVLIMLFDKLDCSHLSFPFTGPLFSKNTNICKTLFYQKSDKITDTICYTSLLLYILNNGGMTTKYNYFIVILFIFRLVGTHLFLINNNRKFLFYFPNFFLEICLGLMFINYFPIVKKFKKTILFMIIIYKFMLEYYLHIYKNPKINPNYE